MSSCTRILAALVPLLLAAGCGSHPATADARSGSPPPAPPEPDTPYGPQHREEAIAAAAGLARHEAHAQLDLEHPSAVFSQVDGSAAAAESGWVVTFHARAAAHSAQTAVVAEPETPAIAPVPPPAPHADSDPATAVGGRPMAPPAEGAPPASGMPPGDLAPPPGAFAVDAEQVTDDEGVTTARPAKPTVGSLVILVARDGRTQVLARL